MLYLLLCQF